MKIGDLVQTFPYDLPDARAQGRVILYSSNERAVIIAFRSPPSFIDPEDLPDGKPTSPFMVILYQQAPGESVWIQLPGERKFIVQTFAGGETNAFQDGERVLE
jgi:hypothetical protein